VGSDRLGPVRRPIIVAVRGRRNRPGIPRYRRAVRPITLEHMELTRSLLVLALFVANLAGIALLTALRPR
jgi:hypothetical protein